jgi:hypothetical protein
LNYNVVTTDQSSASNSIGLSPNTQVLVNDGSVLNDILVAVRALQLPLSVDTNSRQRVLLDSITGALTLATVSTVTSLSQFAGVPANEFINETMLNTWSNVTRPRIS